MCADGAQSGGTDTVVLIHGLWLTALSWEGWIGRYSARGYRVLAPNWPGMDAGIGELRHNPGAVAHLGVTEIAARYDHLIRDLGQPPVIMGHCVGGLVAQILLDRGLGAAGVAIDPAPAKGVVRLSLPMLRAGFPALLGSGDGNKTIRLTPRQFHHALTNTLSEQEAIALHERHYIPGPARVARQVSFAPDGATRVAFEGRWRAPLLLIASGKDHIFPAAVTRASFDRYRKSAAVTAYKEFPQRSHYTISEPGWEQVADYALRWAMEQALGGPEPSGSPAGRPPRWRGCAWMPACW
jgi:pimeloyl-ACP methyl ester carboxylesterase